MENILFNIQDPSGKGYIECYFNPKKQYLSIEAKNIILTQEIIGKFFNIVSEKVRVMKLRTLALELNNCSAKQEDLNKLLKYLSKFKTKGIILILTQTNINDNHAETLAELISNNSNLERFSLRLGKTEITEKGAHILARALSKMKSLKEVGFIIKKNNDEQSKKVLSIIMNKIHAENIETLGFIGLNCGLRTKDLKFFSKLFSRFRNVRRFSISIDENKIGSLNPLADVLLSMHKLRYLDFDANKNYIHTVDKFADALGSLANLEKLYLELEENMLTGGDVCMILRAVDRLSKLRSAELNFEENDVDFEWYDDIRDLSLNIARKVPDFRVHFTCKRHADFETYYYYYTVDSHGISFHGRFP